jgi:hypothetical protein
MLCTDHQYIVRSLSLAFDTVTGLCGWIPVTYLNQMVVVISEVFFQNFLSGYVLQHSIGEYFRSLNQVEVDWGSDEGFELVLKTPFFPCSKMSKRLHVVDFKSWRECLLLGEVGNRTLTPLRIRSVESCLSMGQQFADPANTKKRRRTEKKVRKYYTIRADQKPSIPANGVEWWHDLFSPAILDFFSMGSEACHVVHCKLDVRREVKSYNCVWEQKT